MIKDLRALPGRLRLLLAGVLFTGLTTFMLIPLLAVQLTRAGLGTVQTGVVIGALTVTQQVLALVVGIGVDRWGAGRFIRWGVVLRVLGYGGLLWLGPFWTVVASAALIGTGGAMLGLGIRAELGSVPAGQRRSVYAIRGSFVNIGAMAGPPLGGLAVQGGFHLVLLCAIASHLAFLVLFARSPGVRVVTSAFDVRALRGVLAGPLVLAVSAASALFWLCYSQFTMTVPLFVTDLTGGLAIVWLYAANGLLVIVLQHPLMKHVFGGTNPATVIALGLLSFGLAFALLGPSSGWVLIVGFLLAFTFGEMLLGPTLDEAATRAAPDHVRGTALGMVSMGAAAGSLLGTTGGAALFAVLGPRSYWWTLSVVAVAFGITAFGLARAFRAEAVEPA